MDAKRYRGLAASGNYIGLDSPDLQCCAEDAAEWVLLKRLARYLIHAPQLVFEYKSEESGDGGIIVYTDSDWCSWCTTCRYTSGGVLCVATHVVKTCSTTHGRVALSSADTKV